MKYILIIISSFVVILLLLLFFLPSWEYKVVCINPEDDGRFSQVVFDDIYRASTSKSGTYIKFKKGHKLAPGLDSLKFSPAWRCAVSKWRIKK